MLALSLLQMNLYSKIDSSVNLCFHDYSKLKEVQEPLR